MVMSEARTVGHVMEARQSASANHQRAGFILVVALLCVVAAAEVAFLNFVAAPGSAEMMQQAEGTALPP
jgi:hypothetical protein